MKYRKIPGTDLSVSEFAFGTGDNAGGLVYAETREQYELVENALNAGINYFDCSPDYGKGLGEANLGRILRDMGATDSVTVATKVEIMPEELHRIPQKVEQSIHDSLLRLRRDHVDLLLLHNPSRLTPDLDIRVWTPLTPQQVLEEVAPALEKVRAAGKARFIGVCEERSEPAAVGAVLDSGLFQMVYAWFNLANPSAVRPVDGLPETEHYDGFFEAVRRNDVGVGVIRPLAGGALTRAIYEQGPDGRHPVSGGWYRDHPEELEPERQRAARFAFLESEGQTLVDAAYRYILGHPEVTSIIGGFSARQHIADAAAASDAPGLSEEDLRRINAVHHAGFTPDSSPDSHEESSHE
ncbi:aldo/keto reductase [Aeromicrobium sp. YIM 150415]|uniref:aldo/keto reductase n=1 Tax=Aeromicrobium sp. YIM 150415 TaxID=2803912 RepID=UPI001964A079|nr:aldo/keto reductase [Aeromicrobium sp. YIM 150415]MBM9463591.1 aldo/keto reductase [Aeromicrobium sp. YIM 150415]